MYLLGKTKLGPFTRRWRKRSAYHLPQAADDGDNIFDNGFLCGKTCNLTCTPGRTTGHSSATADDRSCEASGHNSVYFLFQGKRLQSLGIHQRPKDLL